jgi:hypothetical protein
VRFSELVKARCYLFIVNLKSRAGLFPWTTVCIMNHSVWNATPFLSSSKITTDIIEQISYDCEKVTVRACRAVTVLCPSILIGWEMLSGYMIGWEDFLYAARWPCHVPLIFHTHTKSALSHCSTLFSLTLYTLI